MSKLWIGYDKIAFCAASSVQTVEFSEQARTTTGMPILCGAMFVYVAPRAIAGIEQIAFNNPMRGRMIASARKPAPSGQLGAHRAEANDTPTTLFSGTLFG